MNGWSASEWTRLAGRVEGRLTTYIKCLESLRPCLSLSLALGKKYKVIYLNRKDLHYWRNETN